MQFTLVFLEPRVLHSTAKLFLSPVTQIRNVTTASFAAAQGNIGKGANLYESVRLVYENLRRLPAEKLAQEYADLQRLGIVNSQAELRELQELVRKGFGFVDDVDGAVTKGFGSKLSELPVIRWSKKAEALYQGGDDIWKVYNFVFEQNKLRNALGKMSDEARADYLARKEIMLPKTKLNVSTEKYFANLEAANVSPTTQELLMGPAGDQFDILRYIFEDADSALDNLSVGSWSRDYTKRISYSKKRCHSFNTTSTGGSTRDNDRISCR